MIIGGLDIGTTGCKLTLYTGDGDRVGQYYQEYPARRQAGEHELDAAALWRAVRGVLSRGGAEHPGVAAIGVSSFGESFVLLDEADQPLAPALLYTDPRGREELAELAAAVGEERIIATCGMKPHSMYSLSKMMWIARHRPELYRRARRVMLFEDYVVYMLTGAAQIDYSLAARTMAFDIRKKAWDHALLAAAGVDPALLSRPVPSGTAAGPVREPLAGELGLAGTQIVSGCHDQVSAAVGAGVLKPGMAIDGAGTVSCITPVFERPPEDAAFYQDNYAVVPHALPGLYVCYAFSFTGGALLKWFRDQLAQDVAQYAAMRETDFYAELDRRVGEEPTGLMVLPHFAGAATPYMDEGAKGAIVGLSLETTQAELYRALMEGVVYEMALNLERLSRAGLAIDRLRATGGGARSPVWLQMKADCLNLPIDALGDSEAGTVGSVMLAGVAVGAFDSLEAAERLLIKAGRTYQPRPEMHEKYRAIYARYRPLYELLKPLRA